MSSKRRSLFAFFICFLFIQNPAYCLEPSIKSLNIKNPTHLLFIGNSYLYYNDSIHNHVRRMVVEAGLYTQKELKFKSITISGGALRDHPVEAYLKPGKLRIDRPFQFVILQEGSALGWSKKRPRLFKKTVKYFSQKIIEAGAIPILYMTPAYATFHRRFDAAMTGLLARRYVETGNAIRAMVIPVGLAFAEAYARRPDVRLHKDFDGSHPSLLGTYLAACVVFTSLYETSPIGNSYNYFGKVKEPDAKFLQKVAFDTVKRFYGR